MILKKLVWCVLISSCLIPTQVKSANKTTLYTVKEEDDDEKIAKKLNIKLSTLHEANPNINWNRMRPGLNINVPTQASLHTYKKQKKSDFVNSYTVKETDDDLIIARKLGIKLSLLHKLNLSVDWNRMRPGLTLSIPSSSQDFSNQPVGTVPKHLATKGPSTFRYKKIRTNKAQTCCDDVTIRSQPSTNGIQLTQVELNTVGKILDRENGWYKIRFKKDTEGWVRGDMLEPYQTINSKKFSKKEKIERSSPILASKTKKSKIRLRRRNNRLILTEKDIKDIKDPSIISFAKQYLGVRYRFSGTSSRGFDCSGFTSHVYKRHGVSLPHSSRKQSSRGKKVSSSELKTGDLVFFKTNGRKRVNHVGIYVGSGKFIHASSGGGKVQVNKLSEGYYSRRFAGGRRVK